MKVKHILVLLIIICLLSCSKTASMKRRKTKKIGLAPVFIVAIAIVIIIGATAKHVKDNSRKSMIETYSRHLNELEGIKRFFLNSILPICTYAMDATALNSSLLFQFKFKLEKLKHSLPPAEPRTSPCQKESIEDLIEKAEKNIEIKESKGEEKVIKEFKTQFSSEIKYRFDKIEEQIQRIVDFDVKIKDSICFSNAEVDALTQRQTEAFEKLNEEAQKLEKTTNFLQLFRNDEKALKYRETWLENLGKYAPDKEESVENEIKNNTALKRTLKGIIHMVDSFSILLGDDAKKIINKIKQAYAASEIKSPKHILNVIKIAVVHSVSKIVLKKIAVFVLGSIAAPALLIVSAFKNVKSIVDSKRKVSKLEKEIQNRVIEEKIDSENAFRMQSLQVSNMGHNSILCFRMLNMLVKSIIKADIQVKGGLERNENILELCKQNYYVCQTEMRSVNILEIFPDAEVCSKDIFISKDGDNVVLTNNRFVPVNKIKHKSAEFYENLFFSTSDSSIVEIRQCPKITKEKAKEAFLDKIKQIHGYDANDCREIEEHISIQELNLSGNKIVIVKVKDDFIKQCKVLGRGHCYKLEDILKQRSTHSARKIMDDAHLSKPTFSNKDYVLETIKNDQKDLELDLIGSVCELIEQPFKIFSEREKYDIRKALSEYLPGLPDADLRSNSTKYSKLLANFLKPIKLNDSSFIINILDAMLILFNKVIDEKTVVLSFDEHQRSFVEFQMKDYEKSCSAELISYYTRGTKHCIDSQMFKNISTKRMRYRSSIEILKLHQKGWFTEETPGTGTDSNVGEITEDERKQLSESVDEHEIDYLASFFSRFDYKRNHFDLGIGPSPYDFDIGNLVNDEMFEKKNSKIRLRSDFKGFKDCKYTFQLAKIRIDGPSHKPGYKFETEHVKGSLFPKLKISKAEEGEFGFKRYFVVLLRTSSQQIKDKMTEGQESILTSIHRKLAIFNYFKADQASEDETENAGKVKITRNKLFTKNEGQLSVEIFVSPVNRKDSKENGSVCDKIQRNKK